MLITFVILPPAACSGYTRNYVEKCGEYKKPLINPFARTNILPTTIATLAPLYSPAGMKIISIQAATACAALPFSAVHALPQPSSHTAQKTADLPVARI